jgi:hypothetical protein
VREPPPPEAAPRPAPPSGQSNQAGYSSTSVPIPAVTIASSSLSATVAGNIPLALYCPPSVGTCSATVTLRARIKGAAHRGHKPKSTAVTLATGIFTLSEDRRTRVTLHLSGAARTLLAKAHTLLAQLTIVAHDPAGAAHTTQLAVVVHSATTTGHRRHR